MKTEYLEEFIYLAETLSFTKTAEQFYTSRSVISRHVAALEHELGVKIMERSRHNVSLTREGKAFVREAKTLIKDFQRLIDSTRDAAGVSNQLLRIGYLRNASRPYIVHFANWFRENHPAVKLAFSCMNYDELVQAVEEERIDLALSMDFDEPHSESYRIMRIYHDQLYAVMSREDVLAGGSEVSCDDLTGRKLLLSESFSCPGLNKHLVDSFGAKSAFVSFEYFDDPDVTLLRLHVDSSIALMGGYNMPHLGEGIVSLPLVDVDLRFDANAYVSKELEPRLASACYDVVKECRL